MLLACQPCQPTSQTRDSTPYHTQATLHHITSAGTHKAQEQSNKCRKQTSYDKHTRPLVMIHTCVATLSRRDVMCTHMTLRLKGRANYSLLTHKLQLFGSTSCLQNPSKPSKQLHLMKTPNLQASVHKPRGRTETCLVKYQHHTLLQTQHMQVQPSTTTCSDMAHVRSTEQAPAPAAASGAPCCQVARA
jgi:hypothetical protein